MVVLTVILGWAIHEKYAGWESRQPAQQDLLLDAQQSVWAREDAEQAQADQQAALDRQKTYAAEEANVLGGPLGMAVKTPGLSIQQMLNQIALACAPAGTEVSVTVDRFTEFDVAFVLNRTLALAQMAEISRCLLTNGTPYVHSLRFIQGNEVLAELSGANLESVTNWNDLSVDAVKELLVAANASNDSTNETVSSPMAGTDSSAGQDLSPDQLKIKAVQDAFQNDFSNHLRRLNGLLAELNQDTGLSGLQSASQLQSRINSLNDIFL